MRAYLQGLVPRFRRGLTAVIGRALPYLIRRSVRRGLRGVYARGAWDALPPGGVLLAANHHTWWDLYLAWSIGQRLKRPLSGLILPETLRQFPFFRSIGAVPTTELREVLRRLGRGELVVVFPEGELRPAGPVGALEPGLAFLAGRARVPVYPVAIRAAMRGAERPEVFLALGSPVEPSEVAAALTGLLAELEADLQRYDPEQPPPGFVRWSGGGGSTNERTSWVSWWLG